ncbi:glycerophosphodiester phosphodiesterase [Brachybacterium kimchii]|uniref:Glycerophosphodiester phosphodiesterase n=1 Tax=Brachybacterium kimchii TaxID=2942909 RepID=A0ABY4N9I4_9MICO|nr:glycerophosphodiester phosphodiesterase [Brachybacterium kimchii]UQN31214.1 glycerophosphodiester phosphodiesterase [Brachybacterium kimchii]
MDIDAGTEALDSDPAPTSSPSPAPAPAPAPAPEIVAHRGDPVGAIENTREAITRATASGARTVEIDVRLTADGVPVLLHDPTLERLWGDPRPIADISHGELADLAPQIPTLVEALRVAVPARLLIDMPDASPAAASAAAVADARRAAPRIPPPAWCGDLTALRIIRDADADAEIWMTWKQDGMPSQDLVDSLRPRFWNPEHRRVTARSAADARFLGMEVSCWTVDDPARAQDLAALGVRAIISNRAAQVRDEFADGRSGSPAQV